MIVGTGGSIALVALALGAAFEIASPSAKLSTAASSLLSTALGAGIGAIATYLGGGGGNVADGRKGSRENPSEDFPEA